MARCLVSERLDAGGRPAPAFAPVRSTTLGRGARRLGSGRYRPADACREYWDRHADACAELVRLGGVDTGGGLVPPLCVARMVRRAVDGGVVVRGRLEHAASVSALCVDVRAEVGPDGAKFVFPQPCADCGGAVALGADSLPGCRDCRSLFDWESGNGRA